MRTFRSITSSRFGPWAVVTGASAGIGAEFSRQLAANGLHLVLVARREPELRAVEAEIRAASSPSSIEIRRVVVDLAQAGGAGAIEAACAGLDVGLVVSNAGAGNPGDFLAMSRHELAGLAYLNVVSHLELAHAFGARLVARGRGGLLLVGALGASEGIPFMAAAGATKAAIPSLAHALHVELAPHGITVTAMVPGPTDTPVLARFGLGKDELPMRPMPVDRCVYQSLAALEGGRATIVPGALTRFLHAAVPAAVGRRLIAKMFRKGIEARRKELRP